MKAKTFLVLSIILCAGFCALAQGEKSVLLKQHLTAQDLQPGIQAFSPPTSFAEMKTYHYSEWNVNGDGTVTASKAYIRAKGQRNAGIGLLVGGGASLLTGVIMVADGATAIKRDGLLGNGLVGVGRFYETYFGAFFSVAGLAMTIPGAILLPKATSKMKKIKLRWAESHPVQ
jgi:hypothetical protein